MLYYRSTKDMLPAFINVNWGIALLGKPNSYVDSFAAVKRYTRQFHKYDSEMYG